MKIMPVGAFTALVLIVQPAWADTPVAVVEDVSGKPAGVEFMDYVEPGKQGFNRAPGLRDVAPSNSCSG